MPATRQTGKRNTGHDNNRQRADQPSSRRIATRTRPHTVSAGRSRTLAREIACRPSGLLAAKVHLKHVSAATTEGYTKPRELHQAGGKPQVTRSARCLAGFPGVYVKVA